MSSATDAGKQCLVALVQGNWYMSEIVLFLHSEVWLIESVACSYIIPWLIASSFNVFIFGSLWLSVQDGKLKYGGFCDQPNL